MRALSMVVLLLLACADPARADGPRALIDLDPPKREPTALDSVPHPWPGVALSLSAAGAAVPFLLAAAPNPGDGQLITAAALAVVLPAAGHLYAGLNRRAGIGIATRAIGAGIAVAGLATTDSGEGPSWGHVWALAGVTAIATSAFIDVITVASDVEARNAAWLRAHASAGVRATTGGDAPAIAVTVRF